MDYTAAQVDLFNRAIYEEQKDRDRMLLSLMRLSQAGDAEQYNAGVRMIFGL